jgi:prevent-host-death family protein
MVMKASTQPETRTIPAGEFKAKCLKLMDEASEKQQPITITKRGRIVGRFVPETAQPQPFRSIFGLTPGVRMLSDADWKKSKDEWADAWDKSDRRLARQLDGDFREGE